MSTTYDELNEYTFFIGSQAAGSHRVGWDSGVIRFGRYKFTAPVYGASTVTIRKENVGLAEGSHIPVRFFISDDPDLFYTSPDGYEKMGFALTRTYSEGWYTFEGTGDVILRPNKTYYLYIFPGAYSNGSVYSWNYVQELTVAFDGAAGLVHIPIGSKWAVAQAFIKNETGWQLLMPYEKTEMAFKLCGCSGEAHGITESHQAFADVNGSALYAAGQQFLVKKE